MSSNEPRTVSDEKLDDDGLFRKANGELRCKAYSEETDEPCKARSRLVDEETGFCFMHDPAKAEERKKKSRRGGMSRAHRPQPHLRQKEINEHLGQLADYDDAEEAINYLRDMVLKGAINPKLSKEARLWMELWRKIRRDKKTDRVMNDIEKMQKDRSRHRPAEGPKAVS